MKKFDLENIGKKMPYKAPSEEFFANFQSDMMARIASEEEAKKRVITSEKSSTEQPRMGAKRSMMRLFVPLAAAAASLTIGLFVVDKVDYTSPTKDMGYLVTDNLDATMDSYFDSLSDDQLAYLLDNTSSQDDFYSTLPEN
ncbi:MAG: hypothetical protein SNI70_03085 [Rikenellaceae bacterium]